MIYKFMKLFNINVKINKNIVKFDKILNII